MNPDLRIAILSESLVNELVSALGLPGTAFWHNLFWRLSRPVTDRLATIGASFDRIVGAEGLPAGAAWGLTHFCNPIRAQGGENVPAAGPLLVVSNHPGAYDGLVIFSKLPRKDIQWISTEIPFFEHLPHTRSHMLFSSRTDALNRMSVMRSAIRHLRSGGTLVYFGAGHRDPDPATYPGARAMLDNWLEGIDFFFKHVPDLRLQPTIVSGVVSEKWSRSPITFLRRKQIDKQRLSEFGQVITQLLAPGKLMLSPCISFGKPASGTSLLEENSGDSLLPAVIAREKALLEEHCRAFGGDAG
jgi:hypothetical protein